MSIHRFFLTPQDTVDEEAFVIVSEDLIHQWQKVLRFRVGEMVILFDGSEKEFTGEIVSFSNKAIHGKILSTKKCETELPVKIILAQSILKNPDKFEWVLQKGTELGVSEFYPIITKRTERESLHKMERLQRILVEATEQCGRCVVPVLHEPIKYESFLKLPFIVKKETTFLIPNFGTNLRIQDVDFAPKHPVVLCIGPEGGFLDKEVEQAQLVGASMVTLGHRVLRSETAALAAVAQLAVRLE